jgi:hypothetical protein
MAARLELVAEIGGAWRDVSFARVRQKPELKLSHAEAPIAVHHHAAEALPLRGNPAVVGRVN